MNAQKLCNKKIIWHSNKKNLKKSFQSFDYTELCQPMTIDNGGIPVSVSGIQRTAVSVHGGQNSPTTSISSNPASTRSSRPWHDFGRQNDADKIQIPKMWVSNFLIYNFFRILIYEIEAILFNLRVTHTQSQLNES